MTPKIIVHTADKSSNNDDTNSKYTLYGWRNFRIGGTLSRPLFAYIILCVCNFLQNFSVNGANNAVISTLERVFYMDSVQSGVFLSLYDLATVFSSPLVGYLGSRYSSPIFFSLNMIIVGIGNMLIASSNFVNRDKLFNLNSEFLQYVSTYDDVLFECYKDPSNYSNMTDASCLQQERISSSSQTAKLVLYLGNFVNGIGSVALFTIGIAYIERIFPREKAAYCQGIYFAVGTVGGALGIIATGRFLLIYTKLTPKKRLPSWLTPTNPLWIGCWWLPYIIYGGLCIAIGFFVSGLPNYEKPGKKHPIDAPDSASSAQNNAKSKSKKNSFLYFLLNLCKLTFYVLIHLDLEIDREGSLTSISMLSCPPTPGLNRETSELDPDSKNQSKNTPSSLKPLNNEYRLSNRKFRQLSPLEQQPTSTASLTVENTTEGFINHAYLIESLYNQVPPTDSAATPSPLIDTDSAAATPPIDTDSAATPAPPIDTDSAAAAPPPPSTGTDSTPLSTTTGSPSPQIPQRTIAENARHMWSVICELMKNTRYVFIIIASLFEGILIKGRPCILVYFLHIL